MTHQRLLIVDNHDSFTFNLVECVRRVTGHEPVVVPNDTPWALVDLSEVDAVIISPGPGTPARPADLGISADVLREFAGPILGVCLGMQAMVQLSGGIVGSAPRPAHGERAEVSHTGAGLFAGVANPALVVRYHSLVATQVPPVFTVTATLGGRLRDPADDGLVMAIEHREKPWWGVQFHPESVLAEEGELLIANFLDLAGQFYAREYFCVRRLDGAVDPGGLVASGARDNGSAVWLDHGRFSIVAAASAADSGADSGRGARTYSYDLATADEDFFDLANAEFARHRAPARVGNPIPGCDFALGWVGYLGYELGQLCGAGPLAASPGPDAEFLFVDRAVVVDTEADTTYLLSLAGDDEWGIESTPAEEATGPLTTAETWTTQVQPVHDEAAYLKLIGRAQEYLDRGETYEVCLTNRLELDPVPDPLGTYVRLRAANPTSRTGFLRMPGATLLSTSPELFLSVDRWGVVYSCPIKGTRPRGTDAVDDARLLDELRGGDKEHAELLMVVDMVRHDLTRVCTDVAVRGGFQVASYATVHQLFAEVTGRLRPESTPVDAIRAAFPGGSMTGAPKERTMRIISELEGTWRGAYSGAYGFLSLTGTADFSMTIRTVVTAGAGSGSRGGATGAYYGVGGAILAVSDPQAEWEETRVKARPLTRVLGGDA